MLKFYYIDDMTKQQCGPFGTQELLSKNIRQETMVWRSGMVDWLRADSVPELAFLFDAKIPVPKVNVVPVVEEVSKVEQKTFSSGSATVSPNEAFKQSNSTVEERSMPKNWMTESVLLSVLCCSPVSVVGIFYASRVQNLYLDGRHDASYRASDLARNWALLGILFLPVCYMLFFAYTMMSR